MLPPAGTTACKETSLVVALVDIMDFDLLFFVYYGTVFESHFEKVPIFAPTTFKKDNFVDFYKRWNIALPELVGTPCILFVTRRTRT